MNKDYLNEGGEGCNEPDRPYVDIVIAQPIKTEVDAVVSFSTVTEPKKVDPIEAVHGLRMTEQPLAKSVMREPQVKSDGFSAAGTDMDYDAPGDY